jgi:hypothetical protein
MGSIHFKETEYLWIMVSNGLEAEIYRFENLKFPYKKEGKRKNW